MATPVSDPCAEFLDADGTLDVGKLLDTGYHVVSCAVNELEGLTAAHVIARVAHLRQALAHLHAARVISPPANSTVPPPQQ